MPNNSPPPVVVVVGATVGNGGPVVGTDIVDIVEDEEGELPKTNRYNIVSC